MNIDLLIYLLAFICLIAATFRASIPHVDLGWLGVALFVLAFIL